jgi:hypothetical protein
MKQSIFTTLAVFLVVQGTTALPQGSTEDLKPCGEAFYYPDKYTCYPGNFLCPILDGVPTLKCGEDCYLPSMYGCSNGELVYPPPSASASTSAAPSSSSAASTCEETPTVQHLSSPPYENYFYSDCHSANQVVVTSPQPDSNLTIIGPR